MSRRLSLIANDPTGVFQTSVIRGALEVARANSLDLFVCEPGPGGEVDLAGARASAGSLVLASVLSDAALRELSGSGHPVSLISHECADPPLPAVLHDNRQGMQQLLDHLVLDCKRFSPVFVRGEPSQLDAIEREQAFRESLMRHALHVREDQFIRGDFEPAIAAASIRAHLEAGVSFDSVVVTDYLMAISILSELEKFGLAVPKDVAVVAFGDGPEAAAAGLSTVAADVVELGRRGARQLVAQLDGADRKGTHLRGRTLLSTTLVERATSLVDIARE